MVLAVEVASYHLLVAVIATVTIVLFAPLGLLSLVRVFHVCYVFGALYLWTVEWTVDLGLVNDVVNDLSGLVLQL